MIAWFKKLFYVVKNFDAIVKSMDALSYDQRRVERHVDDAVKTIRERTSMHADVHMNGRLHENQIIMIGRYRNRDYIQVFEVPAEDFSGMVRHCTEMQKYAHTGRIDAAFPEMKQIINTEAENCWGKL